MDHPIHRRTSEARLACSATAFCRYWLVRGAPRGVSINALTVLRPALWVQVLSALSPEADLFNDPVLVDRVQVGVHRKAQDFAG